MAAYKKDQLNTYDVTQAVRLNKYLSDAGFCSRRQADKLIEEGKVKVDGKTAQLGMQVYPGQTVEACGKILNRNQEMILLAYHKPAGVECTSAADNPDNIVDHIGYPERIYPIGRLDKNSTGLILLTNTGELVNAISKSVNEHEKEYLVQVDKPLTDEFLSAMRAGVYLEELHVKTRRAKVRRENQDTFSIILTQGLNRQIRRMCKTLGYQVKSLHRIRIMNIRLGHLKTDTYRPVSKAELEQLLFDLGLSEK